MRDGVNHAQKPPPQAPLGEFLSPKTQLVLEAPAPTLPGATALCGAAERGPAAAPRRAVANATGLHLFLLPLAFFKPAVGPPSSGVLLAELGLGTAAAVRPSRPARGSGSVASGHYPIPPAHNRAAG